MRREGRGCGTPSQPEVATPSTTAAPLVAPPLSLPLQHRHCGSHRSSTISALPSPRAVTATPRAPCWPRGCPRRPSIPRASPWPSSATGPSSPCSCAGPASGEVASDEQGRHRRHWAVLQTLTFIPIPCSTPFHLVTSAHPVLTPPFTPSPPACRCWRRAPTPARPCGSSRAPTRRVLTAWRGWTPSTPRGMGARWWRGLRRTWSAR